MNDLEYLNQIETEIGFNLIKAEKKQNLRENHYFVENGYIVSLDISKIKLKKLPSTIQNLTHLQELGFCVEEFPDWIEVLKNLQKLFFSGIEIYPHEIKKFGNLKSLSFSLENSKEPKIPPWIHNLTELNDLFINFPQNTKISINIEFEKLNKLKMIWFEGAFILPENFGNLMNLNTLIIKNSKFELPQTIGNLKSLGSLQINNTNLEYCANKSLSASNEE